MDRPSFLLFVTDQHRADHLGCYGDPVLRTPHIDALAHAGTVFDEFHVATAVCQPNRASLATGRMPSAHGVRMNGIELDLGESTLMSVLREAGYRTALAGKCHLQNITTMPANWPAPDEPRAPRDARSAHPGRYGQEVWQRWEADPAFDLALPYYGFERVALTILHGDEQYGHWRRWLRAQTPEADRLIGPENAIPTPGLRLTARRQAWRTRVPEALYPTAYIADQTIAALADCAESGAPFFIQCSFPDPHHPFTPPGRYWDAYAPEAVRLPASFGAALHDPPPPVAALQAAFAGGERRAGGYAAIACDEQELREAIALNYGGIAAIDDAVGRVLGALDRLGLAARTVVMFTADHGDLMGDRGLLLKGGLHYRSLTRVPFVWRDCAPGRAGARTSALAQTTDIAPTVLARAGLGPVNGMQGRSLLPLLDGRGERVRDALVIEEEGQRRDFGLARRTRMRTLLDGRYRLTIYDGQPFGELYDLREDPHELRNLWNDPGARGRRDALASALAYEMLALTDTSPYPTAAA